MHYLYKAFEQTVDSKEIGSYKTFGITCHTADNPLSTPIIQISDVSLDRDFTEQLVSKFNTYELDPVHLKDAVLDSLL